METGQENHGVAGGSLGKDTVSVLVRSCIIYVNFIPLETRAYMVVLRTSIIYRTIIRASWSICYDSLSDLCLKSSSSC